MAFNWEIKLTFDSTQTDRPAGLDLNSDFIPEIFIFHLVCSIYVHEEVDLKSRPAGLSVCVLLNVDVIE